MTNEPDMIKTLTRGGTAKPPRKRVTVADGAAAFWLGIVAAFLVFGFYNNPRMLSAIGVFYVVALGVYAGRKIGRNNGG